MERIEMCPTLEVLHLLGRKWAVPVLDEIYFSEKYARFNDMASSLHPITPRELNLMLLKLVDSGIVEKVDLRGKTAYTLTKRGVLVHDLIKAIKRQGNKLGNEGYDCVNTRCSQCAQFKVCLNE
ncbi:MAG: winged helix-turn-helix transcriptional regulator [Candidatus Micrarchaeales archaeon]|jgi:DNA-binding HxlR family transcriptional regulator|uniref:Transcriptional regulator, HxlR family n=1 Tax=Candidatus Micrarchaeum acidiphilum ARMAN-2 TaxID=425595 RepID=C7DGZ7_MICA2|nr:MAG: transcriptional regulator, HxlR family [Candidatus Micrarchaeum acidiphilum ARMAN-2]MCW6161445.1 winged helix-turn-helix transcriptional regulator [Candidatus Micrarchaeales archaeon]